MDAVQASQSGHLGLPLGCAEIGAVLFGYALRYNPDQPRWINRDIFVLSGGHGSMFLYAWLHLSGYDLPMSEIKRFRQLHSKTPGHPEFGHTPGVSPNSGWPGVLEYNCRNRLISDMGKSYPLMCSHA